MYEWNNLYTKLQMQLIMHILSYLLKVCLQEIVLIFRNHQSLLHCHICKNTPFSYTWWCTTLYSTEFNKLNRQLTFDYKAIWWWFMFFKNWWWELSNIVFMVINSLTVQLCNSINNSTSTTLPNNIYVKF